jgi:anti-sigma factor RsiW
MSDQCKKWKPLLVAHADGDLEGELASGMEAHLAECARCQAAIDEWQMDTPRFGRVRMSAGFWREPERELIERVCERQPFWRAWLSAIMAPVPVPRVAALAGAMLMLWLALPAPEAPVAGLPAAAPRVSVAEAGVPRHALPAALLGQPAEQPLPQPLLEHEGLLRPAADLG